MTSITVLGRYFVIAAGLACAAVYTLPVWAESGGYEGLIAPAAPESEDSSAAPADTSGYEGLLAPSSDSSARVQQAPAGYEGVVPGHVASPKFTSAPGSVDIDEVQSPPDLRSLSTIYGQDRDGDGVPDDLREPRRVTSAVGHSYIKGKPSMLVVAEKQSEQFMSAIRDKEISPEQRTENVKMAYQQLGSMASAMRAKRAIPDSIYKKMGLSDAYIKEEKASINSTLAHLDKSMADLGQYR